MTSFFPGVGFKALSLHLHLLSMEHPCMKGSCHLCSLCGLHLFCRWPPKSCCELYVLAALSHDMDELVVGSVLSLSAVFTCTATPEYCMMPSSPKRQALAANVLVTTPFRLCFFSFCYCPR